VNNVALKIGQAPKLAHGSIMRHLVAMTVASSAELMATFAVDMLSLLYISWLGHAAWTAGVGFAIIVQRLVGAVNNGFLISVSVSVSRALGAHDFEGAQRLAASTVSLTAIAGAALGLGSLALLDTLLYFLGAAGEAHEAARRFLLIVLPSNGILVLGISLATVVRASGDAKRSVYIMLSGAAMTAVAGPILIFGLKLGVTGAAISAVLASCVLAAVGLWTAVAVRGLVARPQPKEVLLDARPALAVALPAILTSIATPVSDSVLASIVVRFGDAAFAAYSIFNRLVPLVFVGLWGLYSAVGPILGQNWGARRFDRLRATVRDTLALMALYVVLTWGILVAGRNFILLMLNIAGTQTAEFVVFCFFIAGPTLLFLGGLLISIAAFNNLGFPMLGTVFNWGRGIGAVPLALLGASVGGFQGVVVGIASSAFVFGATATVTALRMISRLEASEVAVNQGKRVES